MRNTFQVLMLVSLVGCTGQQENFLSETPVALAVSESYAPELKVSEIFQERKLIREASIVFEVDDVPKTYDSIKQLLKVYRAYTTSENRTDEGVRVEQNLDIRVDDENLDKLTKQIEALGKKIESRRASSDDVTEEYIDRGVRLKTKKELEQRYLEILKKAVTVKDMLEIEEQIGSVREEIESMEARLNYLDHKTSFSALQVTFSKSVIPNSGFKRQLAIAIGSGWNSLMQFFLKVVSLWPFILLSFYPFSLYSGIPDHPVQK